MTRLEPKLVLPPLGMPTACETFEELLEVYRKYLVYVTDTVIESANICQRNYAYYAPQVMRSCLVQGCLEKGLDFRCGGPLYNDGQILSLGMADAADSLYAIKCLIYDEKKYTMAELIEALDDDFVGHDQLYYDFSHCPRFGNDIPEVDSLCAELTAFFNKHLKTKHTFRGGIYTGGCSPFNGIGEASVFCGALPNGKHKNKNCLADSIAATPGCDKKGPTASIKSMLHYDQTDLCSGFVSQLKFDKALFNTPAGKEAFIRLTKTYFANGGQQVSVNVLDKEALLEAQKDPAAYENLIVRVGGYSDYFTKLSPELQQNIIERTSFAL